MLRNVQGPCASSMGFRGSRVQIPPSRYGKQQPDNRLLIVGLFCSLAATPQRNDARAPRRHLGCMRRPLRASHMPMASLNRVQVVAQTVCGPTSKHDARLLLTSSGPVSCVAAAFPPPLA